MKNRLKGPINEGVEERLTGKLRWTDVDRFKSEPPERVLQQEFEIITRWQTEEVIQHEKRKLEWRDVPCE